jgi:glutamate dehydrogenase/leucine dehydrogenase
VAESVKHFYDIFHQSGLSGKTAIIQGWGNVASAAACYLAKEGVKIIGIIDRAGGIIRKEGLSLEEVKALFSNKVGNQLMAPDLLPFDVVNKEIWELGAQIFIPGAASKIVTRAQVDSLIAHNIECISCGANVPFTDDQVFFGPTAKYADEQTGVIPDFLANCGMARVFAYLMQPDIVMTDSAIFSDISAVIRAGLAEVAVNNPSPKKISASALYLALRKLGV